MKRCLKSILLLIVLLVQASCINNLLDYPATTKISSDTFWKTTEDAKEGVNAVYNACFISWQCDFPYLSHHAF